MALTDWAGKKKKGGGAGCKPAIVGVLPESGECAGDWTQVETEGSMLAPRHGGERG